MTEISLLPVSLSRNIGIWSASTSTATVNCSTSYRLFEIRSVGDLSGASGTATVGSGSPPVVTVGAPSAAGCSGATGGKNVSGTFSTSRFLTGDSRTLGDLSLSSLMAAPTSLVTQKYTCAHQIDTGSADRPSDGIATGTFVSASGSTYILYDVAISRCITPGSLRTASSYCA